MINARLLFSVICTSAALLVGCQSSPDSTPEAPGLRLRVALELRPETHIWEAANLFRQELVKAAPEYGIRAGEIKVDFYDQGSIGTERQLLEACYLGVVEVVQVNSSVVTTVEPAYALLDLPYLFVSEQHHREVLNGVIGDELLNQLRPHHLQGLGFYPAGFRDIFYRSPAGKPCVTTPADLAGLKIRVMESPTMISALNALGVTATPIPFSELYQSLKTGVVDGAENSAKVFVSSNYQEAGCNCFTRTEHFTNQHVLIANGDWLTSLEPKHRQRIQQVARQIVPAFDQLWQKATQEAYATMEASGVTVSQVTDKTAFIAKVDQIARQFLQANPASEELYQRVKQQAEPYLHDR